MTTLVLIRHAKTEAQPAGPGGDHARELLPRGHADAQALGATLWEDGLVPDLALVSTAARARQTLEALLEGHGHEVEVWPTRRIYDGGVDGVLEAVREVPGTAAVVWVVGHEPVMSTTAWELTDQGAAQETPAGDSSDVGVDDSRDALTGGMPTASAAVLELGCAWEQVGLGCARLRAVHHGRG